MPPDDPECAVDGCPKPARTRGWCSAHYERWRRNGDPGPAGDGRARAPKFCSVDGCDRRSRNRSGYCDMHHMRWKAHGDPSTTLRPTYGNPLAMADGYVYEHRLIAYEAGLDVEGKHVHHVNETKDDNRPENLGALTPTDHRSEHLRSDGFVTNQYGVWPIKAHRAPTTREQTGH